MRSPDKAAQKIAERFTDVPGQLTVEDAQTLNVLSLFAGVGGIELGLERAGMTTVGQVEMNEFCRRVLAHHWPEVPRHDDVCTAPDWWSSRPRPRVHVVAGGYPCQPFSLAGKQLGTADERWMWPAMAAVVGHVRPDYVVVENVGSLVRDADAFGWMLGDLAKLGFDAEWSVLSAPQFGAPKQSVNGSTSWPTPRASMGSHGISWKRAESGDHRWQLEDYLAFLWLSEGKPRVSGLKPNPEWIGWLMGFPPRWTELPPTATPSSLPPPSTSAA